MQAFIDSTIAFIEAHRVWFPLIMVLFAAAETTAFLSILIPSTPILAGVGALAATGALSFWTLWIGATIGALIGSTFSYWLGLRYGATDAVGLRAEDKPLPIRDLHATILHLLGLKFDELTYYHNGLEERLTGPAEVHVVHEVLA